MRSGSSAAIPRYCTTFVFAPCARELLEKAPFEIAGAPVPLDDGEAEDTTRL